MLVVPKRLLDVPVDVPNPKPVLVEEVAGWLNVVDPNNPPADRNRLLILHSLLCWGALPGFVQGLGGCLVVFCSPFLGLVFSPFPRQYLALSACSRTGCRCCCWSRRLMSQRLPRCSCQSRHLQAQPGEPWGWSCTHPPQHTALPSCLPNKPSSDLFQPQKIPPTLNIAFAILPTEGSFHSRCGILVVCPN